MLLAGKVGCAGIVFLLLATGISRARPTPPDSGANLTAEMSGDAHANDLNDVSGMQTTLQDQGYYRGQVDGVLGLRTRASIRAYQKAENLPVTGELDLRTAGKLGVKPEVRPEHADDTSHDKPSAGIQWTGASRRARRAPRKPVEK
jgi:peptidoglycan hydrolase-like protein with peptidoglycan-binding domain